MLGSAVGLFPAAAAAAVKTFLANRAKPSSLRARFPSPRAHAARVHFIFGTDNRLRHTGAADQLVEAGGCVLIKIASAQADPLPATKFMDHVKLRSRAHPVHSNPNVAAGGAQPLMVEELLAAMGGSRRRNRCRHVANRTTSAAIFVLGPRRWSNVRTPLPPAINLTGDVDRICLAHGCVPLKGGKQPVSLPSAPGSKADDVLKMGHP